MRQYDYLVVGAGITGITAASILAREQNQKVFMVEKRDHIGGNCYDHYDEHGILIHKYGPHIFHTQYKEVWNYLSRFTNWIPYVHRVKACVDDNLVSMPISVRTLEDLFGCPFTVEEMRSWIEKERVLIDQPKNAEEMVLSCMGRTIYEKLFKNYTKKQWGKDARELAPEVTARIPIRFNRDDRYFADPYQGMPEYGYTKMFRHMLDHKNIVAVLNTDYKEIVDSIKFNRIIFTGPIDHFFNYQFGPLPYRGLKFVFKTIRRENAQPVAIINYSNNFSYTRVTEFKHMTMQEHPFTTRCHEYPKKCIPNKNGTIQSYPLPTKKSNELYNKYKRNVATKFKNVKFLGRLAEYRYYNMDMCVKVVMDYLNN